jgi:hypothetical protein
MLSTQKQPQTPALEILKGYRQAVPVNIEGAIRALGLSLKKGDKELPAEISGYIRRLPGDRYEIASNGNEHYFRQRFTLAHELGHYVLHRNLLGDGVNDDRMYRSAPDGGIDNSAIRAVHESQANSFAANFLMPADMILAEVIEPGAFDIKATATRYQVSPSAMRWRLRSLGYSDLAGPDPVLR